MSYLLHFIDFSFNRSYISIYSFLSICLFLILLLLKEFVFLIFLFSQKPFSNLSFFFYIV